MAATVEDVETKLARPMTDSERALTEVLLDDALLILRKRIPDLDERLADGRISQDLLDMIQADMVTRVVRNPDGVRQEMAGSYSYTIGANVPVGEGLMLTAMELRLLGIGGSVGSFRPTLPVPRQRGPWDWWV